MIIVNVNRQYDNIGIENDAFLALGLEYRQKSCKNAYEVTEFARDANIVLFSSAKFDRAQLEELPNLKLLVRYGVGYDNVDLSAAKELEVIVCNSPSYGSYDIASHAFSLLMAANSKIPQYDRNIKSGLFGKCADYRTYRLDEKILGLVGFGRIARNMAIFSHGFGMKTIACDPLFETGKEYDDTLIVSLDELLTISDYVSIHAPLNNSTYHMISEHELSLMKRESVIINTARGALIDEEALLSALQKKSIRAAGIDVYENYPREKDNPFHKLDNIIMTPHIAWDSVEATKALSLEVIDTVTKYVHGDKLNNVVN